MKEHMGGLRAKTQSCPLYRHTQESHNDDEEVPDFIMLPSRKTRGNLHRLATESEEICEGDDDETIQLWNSKSEYGKTKIVRWKPTLDYA